MNKHCVITRMEEHLTAFSYEQEELCEISVLPEPSEENTTTQLGDIYTGRVQNIVPNINAAFVDIGGEICYYSLEANKHTIFLNPKKDQVMHVGDEILVQIDREAVKTKNASATCYLNLTGENLVLTWQKTGCGISKKIPKEQRTQLHCWMKEIPALPEPGIPGKAGWIVRTNAASASRETLLKEAGQLMEQFSSLIRKATASVSGKCLYSNRSAYRDILNQIGSIDGNYIVTDDEELFQRLIQENEIRINPVSIRFHNKDISLSSLYDLTKELHDALSKKVWLNSGGYLIMEPTEALTVIDVNTGKSIHGSKDKEQHLLSLNLEAAQCIAKQLRIRNYSGIIIVDFIDLTEERNKLQLMKYLQELLRKDSIKTTLVDMTRLGLVEITRHKIKKPLHEQW